MAKKAPQLPDFEQAIKQLEEIVEKIEAGTQPLEEDLKLFEQGISLARQCQEALKTAKRRVQILLDQDTLKTEDFSESTTETKDNE